MRSLLIAAAFAATAALGSASFQNTPPAAAIVTRMIAAYRSLQSFEDSAKITRKVGSKQETATLKLASQRPNKYLLELKGESIGTTIVSDGATLVAIRPEKKLYTKGKAPQQMTRADFIGKVEIPSLGARLLTQLLTGTAREGEFANALQAAKVTGPETLGDFKAFVLSLPIDDDTEARIYLATSDSLIRQIRILKKGSVIWQELHETVKADKPIPANTFANALPEDAKMVAELPPLVEPVEVASADKADKADKGSSSGGGSSSATKIARGRSAYTTAGCGRCHDSGAAPDISHEGSDPSRTPQWLADHIKNPRSHNPNSRMPAFGNRLGSSDIDAIAAFLASLK